MRAVSACDTQERCELKVELKLEKLGHGDVVVRVVGSHDESAGNDVRTPVAQTSFGGNRNP